MLRSDCQTGPGSYHTLKYRLASSSTSMIRSRHAAGQLLRQSRSLRSFRNLVNRCPVAGRLIYAHFLGTKNSVQEMRCWGKGVGSVSSSWHTAVKNQAPTLSHEAHRTVQSGSRPWRQWIRGRRPSEAMCSRSPRSLGLVSRPKAGQDLPKCTKEVGAHHGGEDFKIRAKE